VGFGLLIEPNARNENSDQSTPNSKRHPPERRFQPMEKLPLPETEREGILAYIAGGFLAIILAIAGFLAFILPILLKIAILLIIFRVLLEPVIVIYDHLSPENGFFGAIGILFLLYVAIPIAGGLFSYYGRRKLQNDIEFNGDEIIVIFLAIYIISWVVALHLGLSL
jgi:hypothetical protein